MKKLIVLPLLCAYMAAHGDDLTVHNLTVTGTVDASSPGVSLNAGGATPAIGSAGTFFYPAFYGNPATGNIAKFNRLQVGVEALQGSNAPQTPQSWVPGLFGSSMFAASVAVTSQIGGNGIETASRTSDFRTWAGGASGGAAGIYGYGYNDDTTPSTTPIACGVCGVGARAANVNGITVNQMDVGNYGGVVDSYPGDGGPTSGSTYAMLLTAGAYSNSLSPATAALAIGKGQNALFRKGIQIFSPALDTSIGAGGGGIAMELPPQASIRWVTSKTSPTAEVWGSPTGLMVSGALTANGNDALSYTNNSSQSIPNATQTDLIGWTKIFDRTGVNFTPTNGTFTAPTSGYYSVSAQINFGAHPGVVGAQYSLVVLANGANVAAGTVYQDSMATVGISVQVSTVVSLAAGQTLVLAAYQSSGGSVGLGDSAGLNYLSINRIP